MSAMSSESLGRTRCEAVCMHSAALAAVRFRSMLPLWEESFSPVSLGDVHSNSANADPLPPRGTTGEAGAGSVHSKAHRGWREIIRAPKQTPSSAAALCYSHKKQEVAGRRCPGCYFEHHAAAAHHGDVMLVAGISVAAAVGAIEIPSTLSICSVSSFDIRLASSCDDWPDTTRGKERARPNSSEGSNNKNAK